MEYNHDQANDFAIWAYFETWYLVTLGTDRMSHVVYSPRTARLALNMQRAAETQYSPLVQTAITTIVK